MLRIFRQFFKKDFENLTSVEVNRILHEQLNESQQPNIFDFPSNWQPLDSVSDTTPIPGTSLEIGSIGRVFETSQDERIEINQRRGIKGGCGHMLFSLQDIGGICDWCSLEVVILLNQGSITEHQAEEYAHFCKNCASFCLKCHSQRLCARHTKIFQEPTGRFVPLCPRCYEELNPSNLLTKIANFFFGE